METIYTLEQGWGGWKAGQRICASLKRCEEERSASWCDQERLASLLDAGLISEATKAKAKAKSKGKTRGH